MRKELLDLMIQKNSRQSIKVPLNKALVWILVSVGLISGSAFFGVIYYQHIKELYGNDDQFRIVAVVQTTPEQESLKTVYLAELMDLSVDRPLNLYRFNGRDARRKLLASPLIKEARVKRIRPGTVYVDYSLRKPIAFLSDYTNTALDAEGFAFPFKPFFTPKRLPEIILGVPIGEKSVTNSIWGQQIKSKEMELALGLMQHLQKIGGIEASFVRSIDVSDAFATSLGQRQIVLVLEEQIEKNLNGKVIFQTLPQIVRLNSEHYKQSLANYKILREEIGKQDDLVDTSVIKKLPTRIIDLRLPHLGYISSIKIEAVL
jgi:hypothetical protein